MYKNKMIDYILDNTEYVAEYLEGLSLKNIKEIYRVLNTDCTDTREEGI